MGRCGVPVTLGPDDALADDDSRYMLFDDGDVAADAVDIKVDCWGLLLC